MTPEEMAQRIEFLGNQLEQQSTLYANHNQVFADLDIRLSMVEETQKQQRSALLELSTKLTSVHMLASNNRERIDELISSTSGHKESTEMKLDVHAKVIASANKRLDNYVKDFRIVLSNHAKNILALKENVNSMGNHLNQHIDTSNRNFNLVEGMIQQLLIDEIEWSIDDIEPNTPSELN
jgi:chromosome segregation ATPase